MSTVGSQSNIPYQELFNSYKKILIVNSYNNDPITEELFQYYNSIVFHWEANGTHKAKTPCDDNEPYYSSGVEDAIRPRSVRTGGVPPHQDNDLDDSLDTDLEQATELPVPVCIEFTLLLLKRSLIESSIRKMQTQPNLRCWNLPQACRGQHQSPR